MSVDSIRFEVSGLEHDFGVRKVFGGLDFGFGGAHLAVAGANGSGKSTLLRIAAGILTPTLGAAGFTVDSRKIQANDIGLSAPAVRHYNELTVRENIAFLLKLRGMTARELADDAMDIAGLSDRADDFYGELSTGLQRRVSLAAAIAHKPRVLLLDEPSGNLDDAGREVVRRIVELQKTRGMAIVATNDPAEAAEAEESLRLGGADG